jgi:hypothetical protein
MGGGGVGMRSVLKHLLPVFFCALAWGGQGQKREEKTWGRLFFSAPERVQHAQPTQVAHTIIYQGVLHSIDKKPTYWINASMQQVLPKGSMRHNNQLVWSEGKTRITLSPGETYEVTEHLVIPTVLAPAEE